MIRINCMYIIGYNNRERFYASNNVMKCMSTHGQSGVISKSQNGVLTVSIVSQPSKSLGSLSKLTRRPRGGGQQANFYSKGLKAK